MQIDVSTVEAITGIVFALTGGFLGWTWYTQRLSGALVWWGLTFALAAASSAVTFADNGRWNNFHLLIDDYLLILAHALLWGGFRAFNGLNPPYASSGLAIAVFNLMLFSVDLPERQYLQLAILIGLVITMVAAVEFGRETEPTLSWKRVAIAIMGLHAGFLVARLFLVPYGPMPRTIDPENAVLLLFLLEPMLLTVALGFTMIGMVSERLGAAHEAAALTDPLTGAFNRRGLKDWFARDRARAGAFGTVGASVVVADLDHFKAINDAHGHAAGDTVLKRFVALAQHEMRLEDACVRWGGEEFVFVMLRTDVEAAGNVAERLRAGLRASPIELADGRSVRVTASFGVAAADDVPTMAALEARVAAADEAVYRAKAAGRDRVAVALAAGAGAPARVPA